MVQRQSKYLPSALEGLKEYGEKTGHYAWWLWPTAKEGFAEPEPCTRVTSETAADLLRYAPPVWRECLEFSTELIKKDGKEVIPSIDHGRIEYFIKEWEEHKCTPKWLHKVLADLRPVFLPKPKAVKVRKVSV